jgi:hormone-sensitive lipase
MFCGNDSPPPNRFTPNQNSQINMIDSIDEEFEIFESDPTTKSKKIKFFEISVFSPTKLNLKKLVKKKIGLGNVSKVIIHYHGGGFLSMSSKSHQVYLKKYCKQLDALIFSVDYPLAPQSKYPELIENSIKAYLYIINVIEKVMKLKEYKIVLMGDSAGGNICLSVLNWLIMNKLTLPKALFLCYPVCYMNEKVFTPSLVHTMKDYIFSPLKFQLCFDCYLGPNQDTENDFMLR